MSWYYFSFDPKEKWMKSDDRLGRWREVTFPDGMDKWFTASFDPKASGWKKGLAPFGAADAAAHLRLVEPQLRFFEAPY